MSQQKIFRGVLFVVVALWLMAACAAPTAAPAPTPQVIQQTVIVPVQQTVEVPVQQTVVVPQTAVPVQKTVVTIL